MVRVAVLIGLLLVAMSPGEGAAQTPTPAQTTPVVSPEVAADRRVTFRLVAPGAMKAEVDRTFNDPANARVIEEFGGARTSAFAVPGALWTTPAARQGALHTHRYRSAALGTDEHYVVYTPPDYEASGATLPVLYLLHGMGDSAETWVTNGGVNVTLDNLIAQDRATPMVVVMPLGYGGSDLFAFEPFERALLQEIIPQVEQAYRVSPSRDARAVAGVSMGGSHAMSMALRHPDLFAWAGSFSGAFQMGAAAQLAGLRAPIVRGQFALIYAGWGAADTLASVNRQFAADLRSRGATVMTDEVPGLGHVWPLWRQMAGEFLRRVFQIVAAGASGEAKRRR